MILSPLVMDTRQIPSIPSGTENGMERHTTGLFEKVQSSPEHPEMLRLQVVSKVLLSIPFSKKAEFIFILHAPAKIAAFTSLLSSYGDNQGSYCL